jgi:hypothetical protein
VKTERNALFVYMRTKLCLGVHDGESNQVVSLWRASIVSGQMAGNFPSEFSGLTELAERKHARQTIIKPAGTSLRLFPTMRGVPIKIQ